MENKRDYSPYCPECDSCGESGCCPPINCNMGPNGDYYQFYLTELRQTWVLYNRLMNFIDENSEKYQELIDTDEQNQKEVENKFRT